MLTVLLADITQLSVDAVVNAANSTLLGGGGVDGAIHLVGGPAILAACREIRMSRLPDGLTTGQAVSTTAGRLGAKRVIHTVGPIWHNGHNREALLLADCYTNSLELAREEGLQSIAFPAISTGVYGYPADQAAHVAVHTCLAWLAQNPKAHMEITLCAYNRATEVLYLHELQQAGHQARAQVA